MQTLLALSGGYDSTLIAYELLSETSDDVFTFWMDLSAVEYSDPRARRGFYRDVSLAESQALPAIIDWLKTNVRNFSHEIIISSNFGKWGWRVPDMIETATGIAHAKNINRFIYGRSPENRRTQASISREDGYRQLWSKLGPVGSALEMPLIDSWRGRSHAIAKLPLALQAFVVHCNTPLVSNGTASNCGSCDKCTMTIEARNLLSQGITADAVLDYHLKLRSAGPYIGSLLANRAYGGGVPRLSHDYSWKV